MLKPILLTALMMTASTSSWAQSSMSAVSDSASGTTAAASAHDMFGATSGGMMVSEPLAGPTVSGVSSLVDDGVPFLPVEELCGSLAQGAPDVTLAYTECMEAETDAYDRILSGLARYEPGLLASCEVATRAGGGGYLTLLSCLEPSQD